MTLVEIKEKCLLNSIAEYITDFVIPIIVKDEYEYEVDMTNRWVFIVTNFVTFRAKRKYINAYTENDNDCISIKTGKGVFQLISIDDIVAIQYETANDIDI